MKIALEKNSGITLIALVVTIIVLLILASVSISVVLGDNGLIQMAKEAKNATNEAIKREEEELGELYNSVFGEKNEESKIAEEYGKKQTSNKEVTDGNKSLVVPKGFKIVDPYEDHTVEYSDNNNPTIEEGIVIEDEKGNQFVWIPVDNYAENGEADYTEEYDETSQSEKEKIEESVGKYKGFYVARYETGVGDTAVSKKGVEASTNVTLAEAVNKARGMYVGEEYGGTSTLIYGKEWNAVNKFISNKVKWM